MKIVYKDLKKGIVKVVPETSDDIWLLYNIVSEGDIVVAKTSREIKSEQGGGRRIPMTLAIKVKKLEFQQFTERLRVRGIVIEGPEKFGVKGHYHTINIDTGMTVTIIKEYWPKYMIDKLEKSTHLRRKVLIIALDYDEASIAVLTGQGIQVIAEIYSRISGKDSQSFEKEVENYVNKLVDTVLEIMKRYSIDAIIIASPSHLKYEVGKKLREIKDIRIYYDNVSVGGRNGLYELSKRDSIRNVVRELEIGKAVELVEEFMKLLTTQEQRVAYGVDEVEEALKYNAVEKLLVSEEYIKHSNEELRKRIENILIEADKKKVEIYIAPYNTYVCDQVNGLGGIIAILRYPLEYLKILRNKRSNSDRSQ